MVSKIISGFQNNWSVTTKVIVWNWSVPRRWLQVFCDHIQIQGTARQRNSSATQSWWYQYKKPLKQHAKTRIIFHKHMRYKVDYAENNDCVHRLELVFPLLNANKWRAPQNIETIQFIYWFTQYTWQILLSLNLNLIEHFNSPS